MSKFKLNILYLIIIVAFVTKIVPKFLTPLLVCIFILLNIQILSLKNKLEKIAYLYVILTLVSSFFIKNIKIFPEFKIIIYILFSITLINYLAKQKNYTRKIEKTFNLITLFLASEIILKWIFYKGNIRNFRHILVLEKQNYAIVFSICILILLINYLEKKRVIDLLKIGIILFSAVFILQIKTLILILILVFFRFYIIFLQNINYKKLIFCGIIFLLIIFLLKNYIPKDLLNYYRYYILKEKLKLYELKAFDTISIRFHILKEGAHILKKQVLLGIGFENYYNNLQIKYYISAISKLKYYLPKVTENGYLDIILGGGIIRGGILLGIILKPLFNKIKNKKLYSIYLFFIFSNLIQDNLSLSFWIGISFGYISSFTKDINNFKKQNLIKKEEVINIDLSQKNAKLY